MIEWPEAPRGAAAVVRAGFTQSAVRHDVGSPAEILVSFDGVERDRFTLEPHVYALETRLLAPIPESADRPLSIRVEVRADDPRWREVMLEIDLFGAVNESLRRAATGPGPVL